MVSRIRQVLGVQVEIGTVFERPVLASLDERILDIQLAQVDPEELAGLVSLLGELSPDGSSAFQDRAEAGDSRITSAITGRP